MNTKQVSQKKGQGAFEYILLLAGVLLVVVLAIVILRGTVLTGASTNIESGQAAAAAGSCATNYQSEGKPGQLLSGWNQTACCTNGMTDNSPAAATADVKSAAGKFACCKIGIKMPRSAAEIAAYGDLAVGDCVAA